MKTKFLVGGVVAALFLWLGSVAQSADTLRHATLSDFSGAVMVRQGGSTWQAAQMGMTLHPSDEVKTSEGAFAEILLDDGAVGKVKVNEKSLFKIQALDQDLTTRDNITLLDLAIGKVMVQAEKLQGNSKFEVRTPTSTTGVRGTMFEVSVE